MPDRPQPDRRRRTDRRSRPTTPLSMASLTGSRRHSRRKEDESVYHYVDRYSLRSVLVLLMALILSVMDAFFTLSLISMGAATEFNPIMDFFLQFGPVAFLLVKYTLTGSCLIWFLVNKNRSLFGKLKVKYILLSVLILYALLVAYELLLLRKLITLF